jgi:toxin ParE1/3/4
VARYRLTPIARADLFDIAVFTAQQWGPAKRKTYIKALTQCFDLIAAQPRMGRERPEIGTDVRSLGFKSHVIFYRKVGAHAEILRVLHGARDMGA